MVHKAPSIHALLYLIQELYAPTVMKTSFTILLLAPLGWLQLVPVDQSLPCLIQPVASAQAGSYLVSQ